MYNIFIPDTPEPTTEYEITTNYNYNHILHLAAYFGDFFTIQFILSRYKIDTDFIRKHLFNISLQNNHVRITNFISKNYYVYHNVNTNKNERTKLEHIELNNSIMIYNEEYKNINIRVPLKIKK